MAMTKNAFACVVLQRFGFFDRYSFYFSSSIHAVRNDTFTCVRFKNTFYTTATLLFDFFVVYLLSKAYVRRCQRKEIYACDAPT